MPGRTERPDGSWKFQDSGKDPEFPKTPASRPVKGQGISFLHRLCQKNYRKI